MLDKTTAKTYYSWTNATIQASWELILKPNITVSLSCHEQASLIRLRFELDAEDDGRSISQNVA